MLPDDAPPPAAPALARYGFAVGAVATALAFDLALGTVLKLEHLFFFFSAAILFSAFRGGLGPGLLATALTGLAGNFFFLPPVHTLQIWDAQHAVRLGLFVAEGGILSLLGKLFHAAHHARETPRPAPVRYGLAVGAVAAAVLVKLPLLGLLGGAVPFALFYAAVLLSAWAGGVGPGVVALVLSALAADVLFLEPRGTLRIDDAEQAWRLGLFGVEGVLVIYLGTAGFAARLRAEGSAREVARGQAELRRAHAELEARVGERTGELERANAALRLALEAGRMVVWQIDDASGRMTWAGMTPAHGGGWELGYPENMEAFRGQVYPEDLAPTLAALEDCRREGRTFGLRYRCRRPGDGAWRWIESHGQAVREPPGGGDRVLGVTGLSMDVTARVTAEATLVAAKAEAERANLAKSDFLSRMSHELRTPLHAVLGFGQLLENTGLDPRQEESVEHILRGGRHLLGLIDEVLDIARIESGRLDLTPEPVDLPALVAEVLTLLGPMARERDVRLENHVAAGRVGELWLDRPRVRQVLVNLCSNAVKYNRPGGEVAVSCARVGEGDGTLRLSVRDNGPGVTPAQREKMFQPFERLGAERGPVPGTGLGLALCRRLIEAMGGRVGVDAAAPGDGTGSVFWVELPMGPPAAE